MTMPMTQKPSKALNRPGMTLFLSLSAVGLAAIQCCTMHMDNIQPVSKALSNGDVGSGGAG